MDDYHNKLLLNKLLVMKLQIMQEIELYEEQITIIDNILKKHEIIPSKPIQHKKHSIINELILSSSILAITLGALYYLIT
jgi:hypothetical protein